VPGLREHSTSVSLPKTLLLVLAFILIGFLIPHPSSIQPGAWRFFAIFVVTILGLTIEPAPGGAVVLTGVTLAATLGGMTLSKALSGYSDSVVWLVVASNFIARALIKTGLAHRLALSFVRRFGKSTVRLCYSLSLSDMLLAMIVPANSARSGGVILPIALAVSELYESYPGPTASKIGSFLISALYQSICITPAMFLTGQVSNLLAAQMAEQAGYHISWPLWAAAGIVPGLVSLAVVPMIVSRLNPPEIRNTPEASAFAAARLREMGPMAREEKILTVVLVGLSLLWMTASWNRIEITLAAFVAVLALLFAGVLDWEDIKGEKGAWDIFIWYGGLMFFGKTLNDIGIPKLFSEWIGSIVGTKGWIALLILALLIYFYSHYFFATITNHLVSMYSAFVALLMVTHAPLGLVVFAFACFANLSAGLTQYGTTPAPMFFSKKYVSLRMWWTIGLVVSVANILIWSTIGFGWWHLIRIW
jgi:DASS family divalent anion:Na+ symporter